jgi:hypothetical protein
MIQTPYCPQGLSSTLMIAVLVREAVRRMTVQQLYPYNVRALSALCVLAATATI